jgi:outer membrane protein assembly factor BamB
VTRVPLVVVAVLVAMVLTAVALRWRAEVRAPSRARPAPALDAAGGVRPEGLGAGPPPDAPVPSGTPILHGDVRRTHRASGKAPASTPKVRWTRQLGGPIEAQITASLDERTLYAASLDGSLSALAEDDGSVLWTLALGDRVYATPCVAADGTIYVGSDAKKFFAVTPEGKVKWSLDTDGDADTGPAIAGDGTVIFAAGRMVYGVSPAGSVRWRFVARRKVFTAPAVGEGGRVFVGSQDHHVYALATDGRLAWSVDLGVDVDGAPAIDDRGALFVGTDGDEVVRLDPDNGHVVWRAGLGGYVRGPLSIARSGDVLAGVYGPRPREVRIAATDGRVVGEFSVQGTGARDFGVHGGALEDAAGTLVFGAQDDALYAVGADGSLLWRLSTRGDVDAPATVLGDGTVILGSDDGAVRALGPGS